jgi:tetratricopeptide (TPR) repeat protein
MRRLPAAGIAGFGLTCVVLVLPALQSAEELPKEAAVKPPGQRPLQGEDARKADALETKLEQMQEAGRFSEALTLAVALTELRARAQGAAHWEAVNARCTADALRRVLKATTKEQQSYARALALQREAGALEARRRYREAQPKLEQVLAIRRKVLGEDHPDTALSYKNVAVILNAQSKYQEAEEGYQKALAVCRKVLGEEHPYTSTSYNNLAFNQEAQGKYQEAEEGYQKALAIGRKVLGEEHPDTAITYNNLGNTLNARGKYQEAEESYQKALAIRREVLGEKHPDTAGSYLSLAYNQHSQGQYQKAEKGYRKALAIYRSVLGEEHPKTADGYNHLALNLNAQGKYKEADEGYRKALTIRRKMLGEEHPLTALSYNNLALNQNAQGKYKEAEEGFGKALAIRRKVLPEDHPDIAQSFNNLAANQTAQGQHAQAEEGFRKALAINRKMLEEKHPFTAAGYNNLAYIQNAQGRYKEAEEGYRQALAIYRKVLGEEHPFTAAGYDGLALNQQKQGKYQEAEEALGKALAICRKVLGEKHPDTAASYMNLANNQHLQGKYAKAEELARRGAEVFATSRLAIAATGLERAAKTSMKSPSLFLAGLLARNGKPEQAWQRFEESLARGTWDDLSAQLRRPQAERDRETQLTGHIERLTKRIEQVSATNLTTAQSTQRQQLLTQLRQEYDELADFRQQLEKKYGPSAGEVFDRQRIQKALPADAALVGWLDAPGLPTAADPNGEHWAILLRAAGPPIWVRLVGSGERGAWTDADTRLPRQLRTVLQTDNRDWWPLAQRLRRQRLRPLEQHLQAHDGLPAVRHLIVLPSNALAGVPVEIIAEGYTVSYAPSGTMHAHLRQQPTPTSKGLLALANPVFKAPPVQEQPLPPSGVLVTQVQPGSNADYAHLQINDVLLRYGDSSLAGPRDLAHALQRFADSDKTIPVVVWRNGQQRARPFFVQPGKLGVGISPEPAPRVLAEERRLERLAAPADDGYWKPVPNTRSEVNALQKMFATDEPTQLLLSSDASEQRLNELAQSGELSKYRYIHLATHGQTDNDHPLQSAVILSRDRLPNGPQRTQLLLQGKPIPRGRLTAEEVLRQWNLNSDLVTLSACQTALGKYETGEGFVGFAQALILAGSRSVCLSLWEVDSAATTLLMERFYENFLGKREGLKSPMSKAAALAEAKHWLRTLPRQEALERTAQLTRGQALGMHPDPPLQARRGDGPASAKEDCPYAHPYYWAAFVLIGHAD